MGRKLRKLQEKCSTDWQKVPTSVGKACTLADEFLGSINAYVFMAERATWVYREKEIKVKLKTLTDK